MLRVWWELEHSPIFVKFTWLVRIHTWMCQIVFWNNDPIKPLMWGGEMCPKTGFLAFDQPVWAFLKKENLKTVFGTPFPFGKVIFFFVVRRPVPRKMVMLPKNYFSWLFWKILFFFFFEKIVKWKIFKTSKFISILLNFS